MLQKGRGTRSGQTTWCPGQGGRLSDEDHGAKPTQYGVPSREVSDLNPGETFSSVTTRDRNRAGSNTSGSRTCAGRVIRRRKKTRCGARGRAGMARGAKHATGSTANGGGGGGGEGGGLRGHVLGSTGRKLEYPRRCQSPGTGARPKATLQQRQALGKRPRPRWGRP